MTATNTLAISGDSRQETRSLRARLLGHPEIVVGDRIVAPSEWTRRDARLLLYLLLSQPGHAIPRDQAVELLWPEREPAAALNHLYKAIHALRRVVQPAGAGSGAENDLRLQSGVISLSPDLRVELDVARFLDAIAHASMQPVTQHRESLRAAVALYTGDFIADELYLDWISTRRSYLQDLHRSAVLELADSDRAAGEPLLTLPHLRKLVHDDPAHESGHRVLIRAHLAAGQIDTARESYRQLENDLARTVQSEPDAESIALLADINHAADFTARSSLSRLIRFPPLPVPATELIGRERELRAIDSFFAEPSNRLLTLVGPGGIGKTHLALDATRALSESKEFQIAFVGLATVGNFQLVLPEIAAKLGLQNNSAIERNAAETIANAIGDARVLIVLDNLERLLDAAPAIAELLNATPGLRILATSQERLRIRGEHVTEVTPLPVPHPDKLSDGPALRRNESFRLFCARAEMAEPLFSVSSESAATVARICHRLEGIPLALELAAAQVSAFTLAEIEQMLFNRLDMVLAGARDLPTRQQTLRAALSWSVDALQPRELELFHRLAPFAGGADVEMLLAVDAEVCRAYGQIPPTRNEAIRAIGGIAQKSLIRIVNRDDLRRIEILEIVRDFAGELLHHSGENATVRREHALAVAAFCREADEGMVSQEQNTWLDRFDQNHENVRAALDWSLDNDEVDLALEIGGMVWRFWSLRSDRSEGRRWLKRALDAGHSERTSRRAAALRAAGCLAEDQADYGEATKFHTEALSIGEELNDMHRVAQALADLGNVAHMTGDFDAATGFHLRAHVLAEENGIERLIVATANGLGTTAFLRGEFEEARRHFEKLQSYVVIPEHTGVLFESLGVCADSLGDWQIAIEYHEQALAIWTQLDSKRGKANAYTNLAVARFNSGQEFDPTSLIDRAGRLYTEIGDRYGHAHLHLVSGAFALANEPENALSAFILGLQLAQKNQDRVTAIDAIEWIAGATLALGRATESVTLLGVAARFRAELKSKPAIPKTRRIEEWRGAAEAELGAAHFEDALREGGQLDWDQAVELALSLSE